MVTILERTGHSEHCNVCFRGICAIGSYAFYTIEMPKFEFSAVEISPPPKLIIHCGKINVGNIGRTLLFALI